jgi:hypothetical protein
MEMSYNMSDQTITLSYEERSALLTVLALARAEVVFRDPKMLGTLEAITLRVSRLECQPGGCPYCNADRAQEESERYD